MNSKVRIRKQLIASRDNFDEFKYLHQSEMIYLKTKRLIETLFADFHKTDHLTLSNDQINKLDTRKSLGIYLPMKAEPDIFKLAITFPKAVCLPKVAGTDMEFVLYQLGTQLIKSEFGNLYQPDSDKTIIPKVVIVPGLAFDIKGYRIGYGVGHYDRYFAKMHNYPIVKIGVCYDELLFEELPHDIHDVKMDYVVTEKHIYYTKK